MNHALEREIRTGIKLKEAIEQSREIEAAHEAEVKRRIGKDSILGKAVFEMPDWEFFNLCKKYGTEEVHSKGFLRDAQKRFPHLAIAKV